MRYILLFLMLSSASIASSQSKYTPKIKDSTVHSYSSFKRSLKIAYLFQLRSAYSLTDHVNAKGTNYVGRGVDNNFELSRLRIMARTKINQHFDANVLLNLADFSKNIESKVLENAFIRYYNSKYLNIQVGQFRPFFGPEDRTLDYSGQYYLFGNSGWRSFQIGIAAYGDLSAQGSLPIRYHAGIYKARGTSNDIHDHDRKNVYGRLETDLPKKIRLGVSMAHGVAGNDEESALGADVNIIIPLYRKLRLEVLSEYKQGNNFAAYESNGISTGNALNKYKNRGFYIKPNLRNEYKHPLLKAIEFSCRYEYLDENYKMGKNFRHTFTPILGLEISNKYIAKLEVGCTLDSYNHNLPLTSQYSHRTAFAQLQVRF